MRARHPMGGQPAVPCEDCGAMIQPLGMVAHAEKCPVRHDRIVTEAMADFESEWADWEFDALDDYYRSGDEE